MGRIPVGVVGVALLLAGCGSSDGSDEKGSPGPREAPRETTTSEGGLLPPPTEIQIEVEKEFEPGKDVAAASGCLGCHMIGESGNTLGPELTEIGAKRSRKAIERTLIDPTPPMPSYSMLREKNPRQFDELVDFLAALE